MKIYNTDIRLADPSTILMATLLSENSVGTQLLIKRLDIIVTCHIAVVKSFLFLFLLDQSVQLNFNRPSLKKV